MTDAADEANRAGEAALERARAAAEEAARRQAQDALEDALRRQRDAEREA